LMSTSVLLEDAVQEFHQKERGIQIGVSVVGRDSRVYATFNPQRGWKGNVREIGTTHHNLLTLLSNFLGNAAKHGCSGTNPKIGIVYTSDSLQRGVDGTRIKVIDNGGYVDRQSLLEHAHRMGWLGSDVRLDSITDTQILRVMCMADYSTGTGLAKGHGMNAGIGLYKINQKYPDCLDLQINPGRFTAFSLFMPETSCFRPQAQDSISEQCIIYFGPQGRNFGEGLIDVLCDQGVRVLQRNTLEPNMIPHPYTELGSPVTAYIIEGQSCLEQARTWHSNIGCSSNSPGGVFVASIDDARFLKPSML
jgi:hypothetical protein